MRVENSAITDFSGAAPEAQAPSSTDKAIEVVAKVSEIEKIAEQRAAEKVEQEQIVAKESQREAQQIDLEKVAEKLQEFVGNLNTSLQFSVDEESGRDIIKVLDKDSGDVVRQFPSEEVLEVIKSLSKATGVLFDETA